MDGQVTQQTSSYRQGLVLGLTMAEIMLLLIFCLLIAMATFLKVESEKRVDAETKLKTANEQNRTLNVLLDKLGKDASIPDVVIDEARRRGRTPQEYWRELIATNEVIGGFAKSGLTMEEVSDLVRRGFQLKDVDPQNVAANDQIVGGIQKIVSYPTEPAKSPKGFVDSVARALQGKGDFGSKWPPIINLSDAGGFRFTVGSAELSPAFRQDLLETRPAQILEYIKKYDVDVIEVVGHTDEQPLGIRQSNLDRDLVSVLKNEISIGMLIPADNAGLGMARAVSVVSVLRQNNELKAYKIIPLSGAQLVDNDETLSLSGAPGDIGRRRRIEIRLRKSVPEEVSIKTTPAEPPVPRKPQPKPSPAATTPPLVITTPNPPPNTAPRSMFTFPGWLTLQPGSQSRKERE